MSNYMPNHVTIKILAKSLRKGGFIPSDYFNNDKYVMKFLTAAKEMGFHPHEVMSQVKTDRDYVNNVLNKGNQDANGISEKG